MKDIISLREAARRCRRQAGAAAPQQGADELLKLAEEIELRILSLMQSEAAWRSRAHPARVGTPLRAA